MHLIQIVGTATGDPTHHAGEFIVEYEPASMNEKGNYRKDGKLTTTRDPAKARQFPTPAHALIFTRQANGLRPDGLPNRPLTSYTLYIASREEFEESLYGRRY